MNEWTKKSVVQLALHKEKKKGTKQNKKKRNKKNQGEKGIGHLFSPASRAKPPDPLHPAAFDPACWVDTAFIIMSNPPHLSF